MYTEQNISKADCEQLAVKIQKEFYKPVNNSKTSIFLCGADITKHDKIRYKVAEAFSDRWNSYWYDIIYPEDIFDELLYSPHGKDLLSLENLLAESIDVIMIIPESPGSFAELGAFANDEHLRNKILCLIDEKYKKDKSFINKGPVKLVKDVSKHGVIFIDPNNLGKNFSKIVAATNEVKRNSTSKKSSNINLLQLDNFLLPTIYLLEPVKKETIINFVEAVNTDTVNSFQIATTALAMLTKKKHIELTHLGYKLTELGIENYFGLKRLGRRIKIQHQTVALDNLRLELLNLKLRNKKLRL